LLKLARDSGRVVILASDHGHVWHRPDARTLSSETGSRWHLNQGTLEPGELVITGSRVRDGRGGNAVIVPWTEAIHYGRQQNGYHGGATPQEMVCPLVILRDQSSAYSGLFPCEYPKPEWWSTAPDQSSAYSGLFPCEYPKPEWWSTAPTARAAVERSPVSTLPKPRTTLFDGLPEEREETVRPAPAVQPVPIPTKDWIKRLLSSQEYQAQKAMIRRHAPDDALVQSSLEALEASGGLMTPAAFARAANLPPARLDGLIARMQRLLNVDGYEILTLNRNENKVELNVARLKKQFDLD
jgi:hypothetical protein